FYTFHPAFLGPLATTFLFVFLTPGSPEQLTLPHFPELNMGLLVASVLATILLVCGSLSKRTKLMIPQFFLHCTIGAYLNHTYKFEMLTPIGIFALHTFITIPLMGIIWWIVSVQHGIIVININDINDIQENKQNMIST
ncbi:unnamed protein product, partial [Meganyctiphanes norvegica]